MRYKSAAKRSANVTVFVTVSLIAIMGIVAIALDGGMVLDNRRSVQASADAAALAAAEDLYVRWFYNHGLDPANQAKASALSTAAANGYANDGVRSIVTITTSPDQYLEGPNKGTTIPPGYVEVIIQFNQQRGFSSIFGSGDLPVRGRAVARGVRKESTTGVLILNPNAQGALTLGGSAPMNVDGKVIVDSNHSKAAIATGSSGVTSKALDITGNYSTSGNGYFASPVRTGVAPTTDFLASVPVPDPTNMPVISTTKYSVSAGQVLSPGVYSGGISISSQPGVTMLPGIYYIKGGGFQMSGSNSTLTGNGVMIYNAPGDDGKTGDITITGGALVTLTPPTSGVYYGMTLFQDRTVTTAKITLAGESNFNVTGTIYAAKAHVEVTGGSGARLASQYVSDTLTVTGTSSFQDLCPKLGYAPRDIRLTE